jgi:hypothetical protein
MTASGDIVNKLFWLSRQFLFVTVISAQMIYGPTDDPKEYPKSLAHEEMWVVQHPTYGFAHNSNERSEDLVVIASQAIVDSQNPVRRLNHLVQGARAALDIGQNQKAREFAEQSLRVMTDCRQQPWCSVGNTIFYANLVLGRLALLNDNVPEADRFLLLAGETPGSPALGSFGPNMSLARELLKRGRRDVVLQFFAECKAFWKMGRQRDTWMTQVQNGQLPVFGANLAY